MHKTQGLILSITHKKGYTKNLCHQLIWSLLFYIHSFSSTPSIETLLILIITVTSTLELFLHKYNILRLSF